MRPAEFAADEVAVPQPAQHREQLARSAEQLAQLPGPNVGLLHLWRCVALCGAQRTGDPELQRELLLDALRRVGQALTSFKAWPKWAIASTFADRSLARTPACANRRLPEPPIPLP